MAWLHKNRFLHILFLAGLFIANPAGAETLTGTVVSVTDKHFTVRAQLQEKPETTEREFSVLFVPVKNKPRFLCQPYPHCVRIGRTIRLNGQWNKEKDLFLAEEIRGCPNHGRHHHDPTGVRARLGRCRNPQAAP
jgi:hypothetical protein